MCFVLFFARYHEQEDRLSIHAMDSEELSIRQPGINNSDPGIGTGK
jgi:hypothetical protein